MKLRDQDLAGNAAAQVEVQLAAINQPELASFAEFVADAATVHVATRDGVFVGKYGRNPKGDVVLDGTFSPWVDVAGTYIVTAGFPAGTEGPTVTFSMETPKFKASAKPSMADRQRALVEFAIACMQHQGK